METGELGEFRFGSLTVYYRKGSEDEKVLAHSFDNDIYFREVPSFRPRRQPVIVDVGAHIGTFSLLANVKYPNSRIYALEASKDTFEILKRNVEVNGLDIKVMHNALLDKAGKVWLHHNTDSGNWSHSITKAFGGHSEEVDGTTLERLFSDYNIDFIDLVKFNCEGSEFSILMKTPKSLLNKIGLGLILYHEDLADKGYRLRDLMNLFDGKSFRILHIPKSNHRGWLIVWNRGRYTRLYFLLSTFYRRLGFKF